MKYLLGILFSVFSLNLFAQYGNVDHWETIIYNNDNWKWFRGNQQPDTGWKNTNFNDTTWNFSQGGFGFEDGDDSTLIPYDTSVYIRKVFYVQDTALVEALILSADFDDGFVAYLNGYEVARENIGTPWVEPPYNQQATSSSEARLYKGLDPIRYTIKQQLFYALKPGKNVLAVQVHQYYFGGLDLSANFFLNAGIKDTNDYYRENPEWFDAPLYYQEASHLPVFNFTSGSLNDSIKLPGYLNLHYDRNGGLNKYHGIGDEYAGAISIKTRGNSSLAFPKKSYRFETVDGAGNNVDKDLLEFPMDNDWILYAPYSDKSLLRNYLTYNLGSKFLRYSPRTKFVEVMHNGYYLGTYMMTEKIKRDRNRVDIARLHTSDTTGTDITGGYILKIDWDSEPENSFVADHDTIFPGYTNQTYQYYYPDPDIIHPKQKEYIKDFIVDFEDVMLSKNFRDPINGYHNFINKESFADFFIVNELAKNVDGFRFSVYLYKDHVNDGGKINMGPIWDFNLGYGNVDYGSEGAMYTYGWMYDSGGNRLFWYQKLLEDPAFAHFLNCRWEQLRAGPLSTDSVMAQIDSGVAELGFAADKNHNFWNSLGRYIWPNFFVGETYEEEIDYLKNWTIARLNWLDINMPGDCDDEIQSINENFISENISLNIYPNPTTDYVFIENTSLANAMPKEVKIFNNIGQVVYQKSVITQNLNILQVDVMKFPSGIYNLQLITENGEVFNSQIIKK